MKRDHRRTSSASAVAGGTKVLFESLKKGIRPRSAPDLLRPEEEAEAQGLFAHCLLFADQILIHSSGANLKLAALVRWLGKEKIQELLEEDVLAFTFYPALVSYFSIESLKSLGSSATPGIAQLLPTGTDQVGPFEAAELALREQTSLLGPDIRSLARLVEQRTRPVPDLSLLGRIKEDTAQLLRTPVGRALGFEDVEDLDAGTLSNEQTGNYVSLVSNNLLAQISLEAGCDQILGDNYTELVLDWRLSRLAKSLGSALENCKTIFKFEQVPNFVEMAKIGSLDLEKILTVRNNSDSVRFRSWIAELDSDDSIDVVREYVTAIQKSDLGRNLVFKSTKVATYTFVNLGLSLLGPAGVVVSTLLTGIDEFLSERITTRWNPKLFVDHFKS